MEHLEGLHPRRIPGTCRLEHDLFSNALKSRTEKSPARMDQGEGPGNPLKLLGETMLALLKRVVCFSLLTYGICAGAQVDEVGPIKALLGGGNAVGVAVER